MIYFVTAREIGRVKIGVSDEPRGRFVKMRTDSPVPLALERLCEGSFAEEKALHRRFHADRLSGEWFTLSPEIEAYMSTLDAAYAPPAKGLSDAQMIVEATGCAVSYAHQMVSDKFVHKITIPVAVAVYREFGKNIGPLAVATDHEIDILEKFCGRFDKRERSAA
jgi:hypothetical protein